MPSSPAQHFPTQVAVIIPTCNAAAGWPALVNGLRQQDLQPNQVLIVDSSSTDDTRELASAEGYEVVRIERRDFSHGGTRQMALQYVPSAEIVLYLTQDAIPADATAFRNLLRVFDDPASGNCIGAAFGRQLPRPEAGPIEAHARLFNYPTESSVRDLASRETLGIKATFLSNSFSAYRRAALVAVGGFPADVIMAEDALVAARMLMAGWKTAYCADARVFHSHPYTLRQEFSRYFDTGVYHARESWLIENFGAAGGEGMRFLRSEFAYLFPRHLALLPLAAMRTLAKAAGYHLGRREAHFTNSLKRSISFHPSFWDSAPAGKQ
jgi:rhamnosyltransferase